jgi:hypothetical protein
MVKMIATKPHTFGGKVIQAGEEFEAEEQYAATLFSLGRATRKDSSTKTKPTTTKSEEPAPDDNGKKYKTRRVKAEDE